MQSKTDKIDDNIINSLLQSNELKVIVKRLVQNEVKNCGNHESAIEKLTEIFSSSNIYEGKVPLNPSKHSSTIPINDLRSDKTHYPEEEVSKRCALASLFRLIDMEGWAKSIYNIVSLRATDSSNFFYINPFGLLYHEITASSLIKIDIDGTVVDSGSTILGINQTNWMIHKSIYKSRHDVNCIVQVSLPDVVAISSIKSGLLPVSVEAVKLLDVSPKSLSGGGVKYHSPSFDKDGKFNQLIDDLGQSKILFVRNYCLFVCATTIAEAWTLTKTVVTASQAQVRLIQLGGKDLLKSESNFTKMNTLFSNANFERRRFSDNDIDLESELEYEAMMRLLDNAGYRTGHKYTHRQLTSNVEHVKISQKIESISSSSENEEEKATHDNIQICPMPTGEHCANGDGHEEIIQICPMSNENEIDHNEECIVDDYGYDELDKSIGSGNEQCADEQQIVDEICKEVIDNSIKICENDAQSPGRDDSE